MCHSLKTRDLRLDFIKSTFVVVLSLFTGLGSEGNVCAAERVVPDMRGTVFEKVGLEANIDPLLLYAIALCESAYNPDPTEPWVAPYPWVLRTQTHPFYGMTRKEAEDELENLLKQTKVIDVGLMQINVRWNAHRVATPTELLDPLTNVRVGAEILNELFERYPNDAIQAIGFYHSRSKELSRKYALKVWRVFTALRTPS